MCVSGGGVRVDSEAMPAKTPPRPVCAYCMADDVPGAGMLGVICTLLGARTVHVCACRSVGCLWRASQGVLPWDRLVPNSGGGGGRSK